MAKMIISGKIDDISENNLIISRLDGQKDVYSTDNLDIKNLMKHDWIYLIQNDEEDQDQDQSNTLRSTSRSISSFKIVRNDSVDAIIHYIDVCKMINSDPRRMYKSIIDNHNCSHDEMVSMMDNISELRIKYGEYATSDDYISSSKILSQPPDIKDDNKFNFDCFRFIRAYKWNQMRVKRILTINGIGIDKLNHSVMSLSELSKHMIDHYIPYLESTNIGYIHDEMLCEISRHILSRSTSSRRLYLKTKESHLSGYSVERLYRHWIIVNQIRVIGDDDKDYETRLYSLDNSICHHKLRDFMKSSRYNQIPKLSSKISSRLSGIKQVPLSDKQAYILSKCLEHGRSIITGQAGTGKSLTLLNLINVLARSGHNVLVLSFTGKAASSLRRKYNEMYGDIIDDDHKVRIMTGHMSLVNRHNSVDVIIIEEISIFPVKLFVRILDYFDLSHSRDQNMNSGYYTRMIFVGDARQLKSMGDLSVCEYILSEEYNPRLSDDQIIYDVRPKDNHKGNHKVNLELSIIDDIPDRIIPIFCLSEVMRSDLNVSSMSDIIMYMAKNSNLIRDMKLARRYGLSKIRLSESKQKIYKFISSKSMNIEFLPGTETSQDNLGMLYDKYKTMIDSHGIMNVRIITPYKKYTSAINSYIHDQISSSTDECRYNVGDIIIVMKNDYPKQIFNGQEGLVVSKNNRGCSVEFDNKTLDLTNAYLSSNTEYAYAITVHKSQGDEWDIVIVFIPEKCLSSDFISDDLIYTSLSRVKKCLIVMI